MRRRSGDATSLLDCQSGKPFFAARFRPLTTASPGQPSETDERWTRNLPATVLRPTPFASFAFPNTLPDLQRGITQHFNKPLPSRSIFATSGGCTIVFPASPQVLPNPLDFTYDLVFS